MSQREPFNRLTWAEAWAALAAASLVTRLLPFKTYIKLGSVPLRRTPTTSGELAARLVENIGNKAPFRAVCLQRGLALQWMLRRRGLDAILHYGIRMSQDNLDAHVWVSLGGEVVIGAPQHQTYTEVAQFPSRTGGKAS